MSTPRKQKLVILLLLCMGVWPLLHYAAVSYYEINPWKLGGWAMYTQPPPRIKLAISTIKGDSFQRLHRLPSEEAARELKFFRPLRKTLGTLISPEPLARSLLTAFPDVDEIEITVERQVWPLEPPTKRLYSYSRDAR
jgi:hypothetical protein